MRLKVKIVGMHCVICEETIKGRLEQNGFNVEYISHKDGYAVVDCKCPPEGECKCGTAISKIIENIGYKCPESPIKLFAFKQG